MPDRTVTALFARYAEAEDALVRLEALGVPHSDIAIVASHSPDTPEPVSPNAAPLAEKAEIDAAEETGRAAVVGGLVGGGAGMLAGLGFITVPGLGPLLAAGWLAAALTGAGIGAAAGGLIGGLTALGMSETQAAAYADGIRRGGTLVTVRIDEARTHHVMAGLREAGAIDLDARAEGWRAEGWTGGTAGS